MVLTYDGLFLGGSACGMNLQRFKNEIPTEMTATSETKLQKSLRFDAQFFGVSTKHNRLSRHHEEWPAFVVVVVVAAAVNTHSYLNSTVVSKRP